MKFQIGDRVRVYDIDRVSNEACEDIGTVAGIHTCQGAPARNSILVKTDNWQGGFYHPKQLRRLIKKKKTHIEVPKQILNSPHYAHEVSDTINCINWLLDWVRKQEAQK